MIHVRNLLYKIIDTCEPNRGFNADKLKNVVFLTDWHFRMHKNLKLINVDWLIVGGEVFPFHPKHRKDYRPPCAENNYYSNKDHYYYNYFFHLLRIHMSLGRHLGQLFCHEKIKSFKKNPLHQEFLDYAIEIYQRTTPESSASLVELTEPLQYHNHGLDLFGGPTENVEQKMAFYQHDVKRTCFYLSEMLKAWLPSRVCTDTHEPEQ